MMRESTVVTKSFVISMLVVITVISAINIMSTDAQPLIKAAWIGSALFLSAALAVAVTIRKRNAVIALIVAAVIFALAAILVRSNIIQYCGDDICASDECAANCKDCTPRTCQNRVCDLPLERCDNSDDCRCAFGTACVPNRDSNKSLIDDRGCAPVVCGDGFCDHPESTNNCCDDCGCPVEHRCERQACYFIPPSVSVDTRMLTNAIGVTTIAGNPGLTDENGVSRPFFGIVLRSSGYLRDASIKFSIGGIITDRIHLGEITPNTNRTVLWYFKTDQGILLRENDTKTNLTVRVEYRDVNGDNRTKAWLFPMTLYGRDKLDYYGDVALFVTHDYKPAERTPEGIWTEIGTKVNYDGNDTRPDDRIRFPLETIARGKGTRGDLAILVASAYDAAGLSPSIVEGPVLKDGTGLYVRVRSGDKYSILDPALIGKPFSEAIVQRPGYAVHDIARLRYERNYTILSFNESKIVASIN